MERLLQKRDIVESLISRVDEILPACVYNRPSFCIPEESPIITTTSQVVKEIEPVLESLERQLLDISSARQSLRNIETELVAIRSRK